MVSEHIPRPDYADTGIAKSERDAKLAGVIRQLSPEDAKMCKCKFSKDSSGDC